MGKVIGYEACPQCQAEGSDTGGDNATIYEDGGKYCHKKHGQLSGATRTVESTPSDLYAHGEYTAIPTRRITEATARKYKYSTYDTGAQLSPYYKDGKEVYQSIRRPNKEFYTRGKRDGVELFGQHLWSPDKFSENTTKILTIVEGELDALAAYQMLSAGKYENAVVSICNGANNAVRHLKDNYEWLAKWDTVILCLDMDEPGQEASRECAELLPPGRVKIMYISEKDACDMLAKGKSKEFTTAWYDAKVYRPDGIIHISEVQDDEEKPIFTFADDELTTKTIGKEAGELILIGSGSGMGKSTWVRREILHDLQQGMRVGVVMLEETAEDTRDELVGLLVQKPVRKILAQRKLRKIKPNLTFSIPDTLKETELHEARKTLAHLPLFIYDHRGSLDSRNLISRLRHLAVGCGCSSIYLDHISLVVAGGEGDERRDIDALMKSLVSLKEETQATIHIVSQFSRPQGKPYEEGAETHANSFRSSGSMFHAAEIALGLERNQQAETEQERSTVTMRCLKARRSGNTGVVFRKYYSPVTGDFSLTWNELPVMIPELTQETLNV